MELMNNLNFSYHGSVNTEQSELDQLQLISTKSVVRRNIKPITSREELNMILDMLVREQRYREALLIVMGVNFGLRYSDLSALRICDFVNPDLTPKESTVIIEQKTQKPRQLLINPTVHQYLMLHLNNYTVGRGHQVVTPNIGDLIFMNCSNSRPADSHEAAPLSHTSMQRMIKKIMKDAGLKGNYNTHSLRKTFGRLYMADRKGDPTALYELQRLYGHSSPMITFLYIGMTPEEMCRAYQNNYGAETLDKMFSPTFDSVAVGG